ncbi:alanine racemase [Alteribacillus sp. YIM 98480]|uniref:alanine racemase n=1 Tax=Alteribacillus sp. YIM 98480 TaxID=2606599 RepID=UPI00131C288A|nr:alanine racemase [Alteribacillus sp. YIM 98480]
MAFKQTSFRDTWAEVNLNHIKSNVEKTKAHFKQKMHVMAVVKADGYGHGAVKTAEAALQAGAAFLGVALLEEAVELREAGIEAPILVLGRTRPEDSQFAADHDIRLTVFQKDWLVEAEKHLSSKNKLHIHIKVDTGMGRIGIVKKEDLVLFANELKSCEKIEAEGLFTHFATADEKNSSYFQKQYDRFLIMLDATADNIGELSYIHCGNSAAGLRFPDKCFNMFRFGISMYGLTPSEEILDEIPFPLKQAFSLHSRIVQIKKLSPGESISYGATYTTTDEEWIATIPIGYADGWYRYHSTYGGEVLVNGQRAPIVGRICMDQMMIKLPEYTPIGTRVSLIGEQDNESITVLEAANRLHTITYEIPCMISKRVPRIYVGG